MPVIVRGYVGASGGTHNMAAITPDMFSADSSYLYIKLPTNVPISKVLLLTLDVCCEKADDIEFFGNFVPDQRNEELRFDGHVAYSVNLDDHKTVSARLTTDAATNCIRIGTDDIVDAFSGSTTGIEVSNSYYVYTT